MALCFRPPPRGISIPWGGCHTPLPSPAGISVSFQLGWVPSEQNICVKKVVAIYFVAKGNFFLRQNGKKSFRLC